MVDDILRRIVQGDITVFTDLDLAEIFFQSVQRQVKADHADHFPGRIVVWYGDGHDQIAGRELRIRRCHDVFARILLQKLIPDASGDVKRSVGDVSVRLDKLVIFHPGQPDALHGFPADRVGILQIAQHLLVKRRHFKPVSCGRLLHLRHDLPHRRPVADKLSADEERIKILCDLARNRIHLAFYVLVLQGTNGIDDH